MSTGGSTEGGVVRRSVTATTVAILLVGGYAAFDSADLVPGILTTRPFPPPPPTETVGTRTLPVVPQPVPSTSVRMPLPDLAGDTAAPNPSGVRDQLATVLRLAALADASFVVRDGQSGRLLFDQAGEQPRVPASTTKLLSALAIGRAFGPEEALRTTVVQGTAAQSIILVAGGDSLLAPGRGEPEAVAGRAGLGDLADQVATHLEARGVRDVTLGVDTSYAPGPLIAPTWSPTFRPDGITGAVAMLGRSDQRAEQGRAPADPVASTLALFRQRLAERGLRVQLAPGRETKAAPDATELGAVTSAPVHEQLALAITESDNALTEILARQAAFRSGAPEGFAATGAFVIEQVGELGLDTTGVTLVDASGLSRENRVTADLLSRILVMGYDGRHPVLRAALDGLPVGGLSGTLSDRFGAASTRAAAGRARAKTGTLSGANALAGSVVDDDGRLVVFAALVARAGTAEARNALDRFVASLAACGCR